MRAATVLKLAGLAAIAGGGLRIADAFITGMVDDHTLQLAYFATDAFFLLGLLGIYAPRAEALGWGGLIGFVATFLGFLIIRSSASVFFGLGYTFGAEVTLLGLGAMSVVMLIRKNGWRSPPTFWLLSLALGIASAAAKSNAMVMAAGVAFGAGFIAAGIELIAA